MRSVDDTVALLLEGQRCEACGAPLTPDEPCAGCGAIPAVTGPQLREALASAPLSVAEVEAAQAVADGFALLDQAIAKIHEADRIRWLARLELDRNAAQSALAKHEQGRKALLADPQLAAAKRALGKARKELDRAQEEHQEIARAEEVARRYDHGLTARTDAKVRLQAATEVLSGYQQAHARAEADVAPKLAAIAQSDATLTRLRADLAAAQKAFSEPGRIGYGAQAIAAGLARLLIGGQLSDEEKLIAGGIARGICAATGAIDGIIAEARAELLREQENTARGKPLHLQSLGDGNIGVTANPHSPSTPQPFQPAQFPPHPVQPSTTPGF